MNVEPGRRSRWRSGGIRRLGARRLAALLLFAVAICAGGLTLVLAGRSIAGASANEVGLFVLLVAAPTLAFEAACSAPRGVRAVKRLLDSRRAALCPQPTDPPIEQIAADLRRLLWQHDAFMRSNDMPMRARRMWALEGAISDCALQAARALGVPPPAEPGNGRFDKPRLRRLLRALAAEGLVLPSEVRLLASDR
jgi:hypothetical protein